MCIVNEYGKNRCQNNLGWIVIIDVICYIEWGFCGFYYDISVILYGATTMGTVHWDVPLPAHQGTLYLERNLTTTVGTKALVVSA